MSLLLKLLPALCIVLAMTPPKALAKPNLGASLRGGNPKAALAAAQALGKSKRPQDAEILLNALAMGLAPKIAVAALQALEPHARQNALDVLSFYASHRTAQVRVAALGALSKLRDKRAHARIVAALRDTHRSVRAKAATLLADQGSKAAMESLVILLTKGDKAAAPALAKLATPDVARVISEQIGTAPDDLVALCLGAILLRPAFKEEARLEIVKSLGKIPGNESLEQLTNYVASVPEKAKRASRDEADRIVEARLEGM